MSFRILVHTLNNKGVPKLLTFNKVMDYDINQGYLIFKDSHTKKTKRFAVAMTIIEEEDNAFN